MSVLKVLCPTVGNNCLHFSVSFSEETKKGEIALSDSESYNSYSIDEQQFIDILSYLGFDLDSFENHNEIDVSNSKKVGIREAIVYMHNSYL